MNALNHARNAVAYAQVALAGVSTVYLTVVLVDGIQEVRQDRRERKARKAAQDNPNTEN